jgi:hypothetical protein
MAVTIKKKKLTITSLVTRLFGAEEVAMQDFLKKAQELEQTGHVLVITPTTFSITPANTGNGAALSTVPLKSETVTLAMKKKIGHTVKVMSHGQGHNQGQGRRPDQHRTPEVPRQQPRRIGHEARRTCSNRLLRRCHASVPR